MKILTSSNPEHSAGGRQSRRTAGPPLLAGRARVCVQIAANGEEGLKLFEAAKFDVVVTDYRMPRMNGVELIQRIRMVDPDARIILLSGFVEPLGLTEENTGADAVITKSANEAGPPGALGQAAGEPATCASRPARRKRSSTRKQCHRRPAEICHTEDVVLVRLPSVVPVLLVLAAASGAVGWPAPPPAEGDSRWQKAAPAAQSLRDSAALDEEHDVARRGGATGFHPVPRRGAQFALARVPEVRAADPRNQSRRPGPGELVQRAA